MKLRKALGAVGAAALGAAVTNRYIASRAGPLPPALVGEQHTYRWRGFEVAYAEAGDPEDPDVLLLHGVHAAATSQEFDAVFEDLAEEYHVVAPDLPGFGRSDRPPIDYTAAFYRDFVAEFGADCTEDAVCVATSLTGSYAAQAAEDAGFSRLVLVCPTDETGIDPRLGRLFRTPLVGTALFNALASRGSLEWFDEREGYHAPPDPRVVDYQWRTAHQEGARFAPAAFVAGDLDPETSLETALADLDVPVTLVWGREASRPPLSTGRELADAADARLLVVDRARLLPHAEHPAEFLAALDEELPEMAARAPA